MLFSKVFTLLPLLPTLTAAATLLSSFTNTTLLPRRTTRKRHPVPQPSLLPRNIQPPSIPYFQDQCITRQLYPALFTFPSMFVPAFSPFQNLFFIGHSGVSAWAYNTTEGLVVIDSLNNADEVQAILLSGLESFGFRGENIKHLVITHEHVDHYGGALYL
ncbi:hypothetical protein BJX63DRAFT_436125 [Aspergillus granulosus]|uniref:Metallo-beta-lactamase domain-containing protein n=1 Tax=Aspergillus granulosus TaxID=176169 RepID=A0ABR4GZ21_9EURO